MRQLLGRGGGRLRMRKLTVHRSLEDPFSTPGEGAPERAAWTFQTLRSIAAPSRHQQVNLRPEKPQGFPATAAKLSSSVSSNPFKKEPTWGSPCRSLREPAAWAFDTRSPKGEPLHRDLSTVRTPGRGRDFRTPALLAVTSPRDSQPTSHLCKGPRPANLFLMYSQWDSAASWTDSLLTKLS